MSLQQLAAVEVQLCAHFLDIASILRLARCSSRMRQDCDSDFAWKHAPLLLVSSNRPNLQQSCLAAPRAGVHVRWIYDSCNTPPDFMDIPHIREISLVLLESAVLHLPDHCTMVLSHPNVQHSLLTLRFPSGFSLATTTLQTVAQLSSLRTLEFCSFVQFPDCVAPLLLLPSLTELSLHFGWLPHYSAVSSLTQLRGLRSLTLRGVCFPFGRFSNLFCSNRLSQLHHLTLCDLNEILRDEFPSSLEYRDGFSALANLESLTLRHFAGNERILGEVHHARSLRLLMIHLFRHEIYQDELYGDTSLPSADAIRRLRESLPHLRIVLQVFISGLPAELPKSVAQQYERLRARLDELALLGVQLLPSEERIQSPYDF
jgi:hypothetical protein